MKHALEKNKDNKTDIIPNENTKYNCRVLLQIHSMKDNDDIKYYPQVLIEQCGYRPFFNNTIIHPDLFLQILNQMIMMNLNKILMRILYLMSKKQK